jgi:hypothetical protein
MRTSRVRPTTRGMLRSTIVAVAVVIAAAAVSVKLLQPDPESQRRSTGPMQLPATPAGDARDIAEASSPRKAPVQTFRVFASRDPFEPLIEDSGAATDDPASAASADDMQSTDDTGTTAANAENSEDPGSDQADVSGMERTGERSSGANSSRHRSDRTTLPDGSAQVPVRLVSVARAQGAVVRIDGRFHRTSQGERFASNFELVSVGAHCAAILYGDEQFTLCEGQEILK